MDGTKMKYIDAGKGSFAPARILLVILVTQALILSIMPFIASNVQTERNRAGSSFFHTYEGMVSEIHELESNHSSIVKVYNLTTTSKGRTVWAVKISDNPQQNVTLEQDVLFMAGQKANSSISVEIALYLLNYLIDNYGEDTAVTELINRREIWVIPMVNPDGHAYVETGNKEWEKNRRKNEDDTFGVNLNRNYDFHWGIDNHSSSETSSQYYHGPEPFSENETIAIRTLVESQNFVFSLSFSSYGETITYPWGYTNASTPEDELLSEIASDMAIYSGYDVKQSGEIYLNHGNVDDWLYNTGVLPFTVLAGNADIPYESEIKAIAEENIPGCLYLLDIADNPNGAFKAEWTFMVYMGADNNLEEDGIRDFNEMAKVGSDPYVNVLVQFDRAVGEFTSNPDWTDTKRFLVLKDMDPTPSNALESLGEANMADPQILLGFVNWSITNYPAEHYFLDIWGHGQGWMGVTADEFGGPVDWLNMDEIESVLPKFKEKIDVVGFDNCNMAMIEVYTQFIGYTDYIVGSEKEEDAYGWPYDTILADLAAEPETSPLNLSLLIARYYVEWAKEESRYSATVSVVDMNYLLEVINRTDALAKELNWTLSLYYDEIDDAIKGTEEYARPPKPHDLYHFAELVKKYVPNRPIQILAEDLMEGIETLVLANEHWSNPDDPRVPIVDNASGIAVWLYDGNSFSTYKNLDFADLTHWDEFLAAYKNPPPKPQVYFQMNCTLSDSDDEGNKDNITLLCSTNVTGLNITINVYNNENQHITTFHINETIQGTEYNRSFSPYDGDYDYPSDYYNFYAYIVNNENVLQNYSEVTDVWLGNEKPDVVLENVTFYRKDSMLVGGSTGKRPIDGEKSLIKACVANNGSIALPMVTIEFFEGNNLINSTIIDLEIGEQKNITAQWLARAGERSISVVVDRENFIKEVNESNNEIEEVIEVKPNIPVDPLILNGKVFNRDNVNIIGARVRIKNMRTNETMDDTTDQDGYELTLEPNWYHEGDLIDVKATYSSASQNVTVYAYSEDDPLHVDLILDTEVYDALFFFKIGLIAFEIVGFILVIKYYIGMKRQKGGA